MARFSRHLTTLCALSIAAFLFSAACQSSSTTVTGPSGMKCAMTLPSTVPTIAANGGTGSVAITIAAECVWSASSASEWISITSTPSGQGNGTVNFAATGNPTALVRRGTLVIGERRVELTQTGAACQFTLAPQTATIAADGGDGAITVNTIEGCQWTASSQSEWIAIAGPTGGTGSGTVRFSASANDGPARSALVSVADRTFAVNQAASGTACAISLDTSEQTIAADGGVDTVIVTSRGDCAWTAVSQAPWITVTSGATGRGTGTVSLTVAANSGNTRVGLVTIGGQTYVITQTAGGSTNCSYTLGSTQFAAPAAGGATTVNVIATAGCGWAASTNASWIIVASGGGAGNGTVTLTIVANSGGQRSGTAIIAGRTFTVTQAAQAAPSCSYALSSDTQSVGSAGGTASVSVTAAGGCGWTASSQTSWITVSSGTSGSGNGTVTLAIAANNAAARSGTVTIAGMTHTISQASGLLPCTYAIDATEATSSAAGGTIQIAVTSGILCNWTAQSNVPWVTVTSGSNGLGNGIVRLAVAANGGVERTGTVTVAGHTFTIAQAPAPAACTYAINPSTQSIGPLGGEFSIAISTQSGCAWSATTGDNWIQLGNGTSGTGSGTLTYRVGLGLIFSRTGRITISGQVLTINQAAVLLSNAR
jgi:hypothetical protein